MGFNRYDGTAMKLKDVKRCILIMQYIFFKKVAPWQNAFSEEPKSFVCLHFLITFIIKKSETLKFNGRNPFRAV